MEQRHLQRVLQLMHLHAEGGLRDVEAVRGGAEALVLGDQPERDQVVEIEAPLQRQAAVGLEQLVGWRFHGIN